VIINYEILIGIFILLIISFLVYLGVPYIKYKIYTI